MMPNKKDRTSVCHYFGILWSYFYLFRVQVWPGLVSSDQKTSKADEDSEGSAKNCDGNRWAVVVEPVQNESTISGVGKCPNQFESPILKHPPSPNSKLGDLFYYQGVFDIKELKENDFKINEISYTTQLK